MRLADEIVNALPAMLELHPRGPSLADVAAAMACAPQFVRAALDEVRAAGSAIVVRYPKEKGRRLVPLGYDFGERLRACKNCDALFQHAPKSKRQCCTKACGIAWSWTRPGVAEKRAKGIRAQKATPEGKALHAATNAKRWANQENRKRLSEQSKERWADPRERAKMSAAIQAVNGSPEARRQWSEIRKRQWKDPTFREKTEAALAEARKTPEYRESRRRAMKKRWADPEQRERFIAANRARNDHKRGMKQSPEHIEKRRASRRRTMEAKRNQPASLTQKSTP